MITREEANELAKAMGLPDSAAGLCARFSEEGDRLEIQLFSISGRPLAVADIVTGLSHFAAEVVRGKINGDTALRWSPRDEAPLAPTPPPAPAARYWGEDAESQRKETEGPGRGNPPPAN